MAFEEKNNRNRNENLIGDNWVITEQNDICVHAQ